MKIIAIAGGSGSGKTTFVNNLIDKISESDIAVIAQDGYYKHQPEIAAEERKLQNYDHPDATEWTLLLQHLQQLKEGKTVQIPQYSYINHLRLNETVTIAPKPVIILEGILVLSQQQIINQCDLSIYLDCDADERVLRIAKRDSEERGRAMDEISFRYRETVKPMHNKFIEPSKNVADIIVPKGGENKKAVAIIANYLNTL